MKEDKIYFLSNKLYMRMYKMKKLTKRIVITASVIVLLFGGFTLGVYANENWLKFTGEEQLEGVSDNTQEILNMLQSTENKRADAIEDLETARSEKSDLENDLADITKERNYLITERDGLETSNQEKANTITSLNAKIKEKDLEIKELEGQIKGLESQIKDLKKDIADLETKNQKLKDDLEAEKDSSKEDKENHKEEVKELKNEVKRLEGELKKANNKSKETKDQSDKDLKKAKEIIGEVEED